MIDLYLGWAGGTLLFWTGGQTLTCWSHQFSDGRETRTLKIILNFSCLNVIP